MKKGSRHTSASKKKMSDAQSDRSEETRRTMSDAQKGRSPPNKGQPMSEAQKKKQSEAMKGRPSGNKGKKLSNAARKKMSEAHKGMAHTDTTKKKISEANKGRKFSDEHKQKISEANKGKPRSEETRRRASATKQRIPYEEWEEFAKEQKYCPTFNEGCKESNREKYGRKCFICGKLESKNMTKSGTPKKLSVHHVDMNKAQGCAGHRWKLVPLCMSCHNKAHNAELVARLEYICEHEVK